MIHFTRRRMVLAALITLSASVLPAAGGGVDFTGRFAPHQGLLCEYESPQRLEMCLNGRWQFQPVGIPGDYVWNKGIVPALSLPQADQWEATAIRIPSPWNVNDWGLWGKAGAYDPVPLYFPSYPENWKGALMGWHRRSFHIPADWAGRRLVLHFAGVAGECQVLVNGKPAIASHYDSFTPFEADITELVNPSGDNELLVGVRSHRLFQKAHPQHKWGWEAMGPSGSDMNHLCGIYQDVYLLGLPQVRVQEVFVKPWLDRDELEMDITLANSTAQPQTVTVGGVARPWHNLAGKDILSAPESRWTLDDPVLTVAAQEVKLAPGESKTITCRESVKGRLQLWSPQHPNLYGLLLAVEQDGRQQDKSFTRFGWRQFTIRQGDLYLNSQRIQLYGDILHPFSSFILTRRTAWAWFTMIKDSGGNAVRPHAQPWPQYYIDMADEMGIVVLDEAGVFGSAGGFNMDEEQAWQNCRDEYEALIRRDRNHPSVMGWSFANEMFALGALNTIPEGRFDAYRDKLAAMGRLAYQLDPTRPWISCDGDDDLNGRLPVWSKHWGDGWKDKQNTHYQLPDTDDKPWMLGEYSGSYYGTPDRLDYLNGDEAYASYAGRAQALGIDIYELASGIARDKLDYFSASETVWFGLEHLNFGYNDFSRLPAATDGVFFSRPYQEGEPGMQPERLPPFITTLNPGWDPSLPIYKPLGMFQAMKAGLAPGQPAPFSGRVPFKVRPAIPAATIGAVGFIGDRQGMLYAFLQEHHLPLVESNAASFVILDTHTGLTQAGMAQSVASVLSGGGTVLVMLRNQEVDLKTLNTLLPQPVILADRQATSLVHGAEHGLTAPFSLKELYFVEQDKQIPVMSCGMGGPLVEKSTVLLRASDIDWSLFNAPENRKCAALVLYEKLHKSSGAALMECAIGKGRVLLCSIDTANKSKKITPFWDKLFACFGIDLTGSLPASNQNAAQPQPHDLLRDGPLN